MAEEAAHIEINILNNPIGKQDQYAAAFGGMNQFNFNSDDTVTIKPIVIESSKIKKLFDSILTYWTGISRPAKMVLQEQDKKNTTNQTNINKLLSMRIQVDDLRGILLNYFNINDVCELIHNSWQMKKSLASNVSNSKIDEYYSLARRHGAIGGKISGAGAGGFLSFIAEKKNHSKINNELTKKGLIPYKFNLDQFGTSAHLI